MKQIFENCFVKCATSTTYESYLGVHLDFAIAFSSLVIIVEGARSNIASCHVLDNHAYDLAISLANKL